MFISQLPDKENQSNMKGFFPKQPKVIGVSLCSFSHLPNQSTAEFKDRFLEQLFAVAFVLRQCNFNSQCFNSVLQGFLFLFFVFVKKKNRFALFGSKVLNCPKSSDMM